MRRVVDHEKIPLNIDSDEKQIENRNEMQHHLEVNVDDEIAPWIKAVSTKKGHKYI